MHNYETHEGYSAAIEKAVGLASKYRIGTMANVRIAFNPELRTFVVAERGKGGAFDDQQSLKTVAYAQRWSHDTVQIRGFGSPQFADFIRF